VLLARAQRLLGRLLHLRKSTFPGRPRFIHPEFDHEPRIVTAQLGDLIVASAYVPNGGKDLPAKIRFLEGLDRFAAAAQAEGKGLVLCGDLNVAARDRRPSKLRKADRSAPPRWSASCSRRSSRADWWIWAQVRPRRRPSLHLVAPGATFAATNIGWRIDYVLASTGLRRERPLAGFREFGTSDHGPLQAVSNAPAPTYEPAPTPSPRPWLRRLHRHRSAPVARSTHTRGGPRTRSPFRPFMRKL